MSEERVTQLRESLFQLERRIRPLEWDAGRNQINEFKKQQLVKLKEELNTLTQELSSLETKP